MLRTSSAACFASVSARLGGVYSATACFTIKSSTPLCELGTPGIRVAAGLGGGIVVGIGDTWLCELELAACVAAGLCGGAPQAIGSEKGVCVPTFACESRGDVCVPVVDVQTSDTRFPGFSIAARASACASSKRRLYLATMISICSALAAWAIAGGMVHVCAKMATEGGYHPVTERRRLRVAMGHSHQN